MDDKKTFTDSINELGSRIKAYFKDKNIEDVKNTKVIKDGLSYVQGAVYDVKKAVDSKNNKKLEKAIEHLTDVLKKKELQVNVQPPVVNVPESKVEVLKEAKEAKETNELLKKVLQSMMRKEADNSVYIQNRRPNEAMPVILTEKSGKRFYDAVMMAVTSARSSSSGGGGGDSVEVTNFPAEYPLPAAQVATLTPPAAITGFATEATLASVLTKLIAAPSTEAKQDDLIKELQSLDGKDYATQTTLAALLAKVIAAPATEAKQDTGNTSLATIAGVDFATQTTLAAILAKLIAAPATEAKQDDIISALGGTSTTGTTSSVGDSASTVTLLASNTNRKGATIYNDSTATLYVKLGATASLTDFTMVCDARGYFEVPYGYTGIIDGIWSSDAGGDARITELT